MDGDSEFAPELAGNGDESLFSRTYALDPPSREVIRTSRFALLVDYSPLVAGHLLVVPLRYAPSWAELGHAEWQDWLVLHERLNYGYATRWGSPTYVEHGSLESSRDSACITHAHLHLFPPALDFRAAMRADGLKMTSARDQRDIRRADRFPNPYYYIQDSEGAEFAWADAPPMPKQYLRRIVCRQLGIADPDYDWTLTVRKGVLRSTLAQAQGL